MELKFHLPSKEITPFCWKNTPQAGRTPPRLAKIRKGAEGLRLSGCGGGGEGKVGKALVCAPGELCKLELNVSSRPPSVISLEKH